MYEELVKRLRAQAVYLPEKFSKNAELLDVLMKAADAIENMSEAYDKLSRHMDDLAALMPRWIPVTERLPEVNKQVLVYVGFFQPYTEVAYYCGEWRFAYDDTEVPAVYYWMTLPEPPKEET